MARDKNIGGFNTLNSDSKDKHTHMDFDDTASNVDDVEEFEEENKEVEELDDNTSTEQGTSTTKEKKNNVQALLGEEEKSDKVLRGFYLEPYINDAIDKATQDKKRGARTKLVNLLLEQSLEENGML